MGTISNPAISVVIPVYNCVQYVEESVESVLSQTGAPLDVIVVDDGSSDGSLEVLRKYVPVIRLFGMDHRGIGAARNHGVSQATGDYLAFHDADDIWTPQRLQKLLQLLEQRPELDYVHGLVHQFRSPEINIMSAEREQIHQKYYSTPIAAACLFRKASFDRIGLFREDLRMGEFIDWLARAQDAQLKTELLQSVVLERRLHCSNTGIRERAHRVEYATVLRDILERRRAMTIGTGDVEPRR